MGLKFFDNNGKGNMFFCATCHVFLADRDELVSTCFTGVTGQAYLFKSVRNVTSGELDKRMMMTGMHHVRDVFCNCCGEHIGWMYEMAPIEKETYKEGHVILERLHIIESEGMMNASGNPTGHGNNFHAAFNRIRRYGQAMPNEAQRAELVELLRQQHNPNALEIPYFSLTRDRRAPVIVCHNEERVEMLIEDHRRFQVFMRTLRRFNAAIARSAVGGNNRDLKQMGFKQEFAAQYGELQAMMDGEPYIPSPQADRSLIELFGRMQQERDRVRLEDDDLIEEFNDHRRRDPLAEIRELHGINPNPRRQPPLQPGHAVILPAHPRGPVAAMMADNNFQQAIRQRMNEFRANVVGREVAEQYHRRERDRQIQEWEQMVRQEEEEDEFAMMH